MVVSLSSSKSSESLAFYANRPVYPRDTCFAPMHAAHFLKPMHFAAGIASEGQWGISNFALYIDI